MAHAHVTKVNVRDLRRNLRELIERARAGEELVILRYGKPVARLVPPEREPKQFPDLTEFRASIKLKGESPHETIMKMREEYRY